jgi:hypothetical protein
MEILRRSVLRIRQASKVRFIIPNLTMDEGFSVSYCHQCDGWLKGMMVT